MAVRGYLSASLGEQGARNALLALPGVAAVDLQVQAVDADKCPVVSVFAPYWVAHRQAGGGAALRLAGAPASAKAELTEGDSLMIDVTTPPRESYISLDYYSLQGNVTHLLPNPRSPNSRAPPNYTATIGSLGEWGIAGPFGTELVVLVTTPVAPFDAPRPVSEPSAGYLADLAKRLEQIRARSGPGAIGIEFLQIRTRARPR